MPIEDLCEHKLDGERIYEGRILDLEVDRVRLASGSEAFREVIRHRGAAVMLPLLEGNRVVFVKQYRYPLAEVILELPAGKIDPGEDPQVCAERELEEETGWHARTMHSLGPIFTTPGFTDEVIHCFLATDLVPAENVEPDPDEAIEIVTMTVEEALEACRNGLIRDSKTIATLFLARLNGKL